MLHDSTDFGSTNTIGLYAFCYDTRERFDILHGDFYEAICRWRRKLGDNRGIEFFFVRKDGICSLCYWNAVYIILMPDLAEYGESTFGAHNANQIPGYIMKPQPPINPPIHPHCT
jgi:hypothetical protein